VLGEDWTGSQNLVPVAMKAALGLRPPLKVFGDDYPTPDGTAIRDYIHVEDLADAHVKALDYLRRGGQTVALNVGTGTGSSVREVLDTIARFSGAPVPHEIVARRVGDPVALYSDNSLVRATIGWEPSKGLDEIIATAWRWHSAVAAR
jgi:UDP-glucose 4-epimerase